MGMLTLGLAHGEVVKIGESVFVRHETDRRGRKKLQIVAPGLAIERLGVMSVDQMFDQEGQVNHGQKE